MYRCDVLLELIQRLGVALYHGSLRSRPVLALIRRPPARETDMRGEDPPELAQIISS